MPHAFAPFANAWERLVITVTPNSSAKENALRLVSDSDVFTPTGRTKIGVTWDLSVKKIDDKRREFTNTVHSSATPELLDFLGKQGIPGRSSKLPVSLFQRLITGRRRLSSQRVSIVTP